MSGMTGKVESNPAKIVVFNQILNQFVNETQFWIEYILKTVNLRVRLWCNLQPLNLYLPGPAEEETLLIRTDGRRQV